MLKATLDFKLDEYYEPTEESIKNLIEALNDDFCYVGQFLIEDFPYLVDMIGYGNVVITDGLNVLNKQIKIISYSTGGWSAQETLIDALLHKTYAISVFYYTSWKRGGHYTFEVYT